MSRGHYGLENLDVTSTAAQIAGKPFLYFFECGPRFLTQEMKGGKNHSRRANATLCAAAFQKSLLQRMQLRACRESLDGDNVRSLRLQDRDEAAIYKCALH